MAGWNCDYRMHEGVGCMWAVYNNSNNRYILTAPDPNRP